MQTLVLTIHILACLFLIVLVLLQAGKEDMGVIFGGGSGSVFGSTGAGGILVKITAVLSAVFLITSLTYNYLTGDKYVDESSLMLEGDGIVTPVPEEVENAAPKGVQFETDDQPGDTSAAPAKEETAQAPAQDETQ